jgi:D-alanyl-lipoteichoic acid acyltransferase DltB (MBOAT superfamily)
MAFTEPVFLLFLLPAFLLAFYGTARLFGRDTALAVIFLVSCLWYAKWGAGFLALMVLGTVVNFAICFALLRIGDSRPRLRALLFALGQAYNFGTLIYFKYFTYLWYALGTTHGESLQLSGIPVGISFYTFQQAVLLVDAYARQRAVATYVSPAPGLGAKLVAFFRYGAFHCFFPQLVVGPITYLSEFGPQTLRRAFGRPRRIDFEVGLTLLAIGMFKKLALADGLAAIANPAFDAARDGLGLSAQQAWAGTLAYYAQLYFDFSGYSDMALGAARLFGLRLPINFDSPLRATGIVDFYRRWHITLTRVIARFLFAPLSLWGTRFAAEKSLPTLPRKLVSVWLPMLVNFEVIALWHGALSTFVVFGLVHGLWYILETEVRASRSWRAYRKVTSDARRRVQGQLLAFLPLLLTFALFRSETLPGFARIASSLVAVGASEPAEIDTSRSAWWLIAAAFAVIWLLPNSMEFTERYAPGIRAWRNLSTTPPPLRLLWRPTLAWAPLVGGLAVVGWLYINRELPFLYMGF